MDGASLGNVDGLPDKALGSPLENELGSELAPTISSLLGDELG